MFISPQCIPSGSFTSQSSHSPSSAIFPWQVTLTLGFTPCNSSSYNNKQGHPQYRAKPNVRYHAADLALMGLEEPSTRWSAFIFFGQVQPTIRPCGTVGKLPQGQLHSCGIFIKDPQSPPQAPGPPLQGGAFFVYFPQPIHKIPNAFTLL